MKNGLSIIASAACLAAIAICFVLWVRTREGTSDGIHYATATSDGNLRIVEMCTLVGRIYLGSVVQEFDLAQDEGGFFITWGEDRWSRGFFYFIFTHEYGASLGSFSVAYRVPPEEEGLSSMYSIGVPFWFLCLVFAILPVRTTRRLWRLQRRRAAGLCIHCGYDLCATPHRCPECGHVPEGRHDDIIRNTDQESP